MIIYRIFGIRNSDDFFQILDPDPYQYDTEPQHWWCGSGPYPDLFAGPGSGTFLPPDPDPGSDKK